VPDQLLDFQNEKQGDADAENFQAMDKIYRPSVKKLLHKGGISENRLQGNHHGHRNDDRPLVANNRLKLNEEHRR